VSGPAHSFVHDGKIAHLLRAERRGPDGCGNCALSYDMSPDTASVLIRACSFIALFQSGGVILFTALCARWQQHSYPALRRLGLGAVIAAAVFTGLHYVLEAGRLGGDWASVLDGELQLLVWQGSLGSAWIARMAALAFIGAALASSKQPAVTLGLIGSALLVSSFMLVGHTREAELPWLRGMLAAHLATVIFWFGSLLPLRIVLLDESVPQAAHIVQLFSKWAVWMVAVLFIAGAVLLASLLPNWTALFDPYGCLVMGKVAAFAVLLALAAINKWRYVPRLASEPAALLALRRVILAEYLLIVGVLALTAVLTSFFSP
jgi:putative copper export protein